MGEQLSAKNCDCFELCRVKVVFFYGSKDSLKGSEGVYFSLTADYAIITQIVPVTLIQIRQTTKDTSVKQVNKIFETKSLFKLHVV